MVERIKKLLENLQLSPSAFADAIGVQRSSMSHLLSGRNKPSLDFVTKVINTYPDTDLHWLITGSKLLKEHSESNIPKPESVNVRPKINTTAKADIESIIVLKQDGSFESYTRSE